MNGSRCAVTFLPDDKRVVVPSGTLVHDAILQAGLAVDTPCGGQGRCGRCLVRIDKGEVQRKSSAHLSSSQIDLGWALACRTEIQGDATVFLLPAKTRDKAVVTGAARIPRPRRARPSREPVVSQHFLELSPPSLEDNVSDLERVRHVLREKAGIKELAVGLSISREIDEVLRQGEWRATAVIERDLRRPTSGRLVALRSGDVMGESLGAAVDIGTTTVAVMLVELGSGRVIDSVTRFNRQISCGEDVISRIIYSLRGDGLKHLQRLVRETINELLDELCDRNSLEQGWIDHIVVSGNTTMEHLFLGLNPRYIREEPYAPVATRFPAASALELGLKANPNASVYCMPAVAAYVGSDITAGILSSGLYRKQGLTLFMDVGTNGELVLGNADWMATCACSAGPAFEGAGVRCGVRATTGAIEDVTINYRTLEPTVQVIGGGLPLGVCGSGMIAVLGELFVTGVVDKSGRINTAHPRASSGLRNRIVTTEHGPGYVLVWAEESSAGEDIVLNEVDINNLIRTKGSIYAGVMVMLQSLGISATDIEEVLIGGAFGQHINVEKAIMIGLLPDLAWDKFHFLGNTSVQGAYQALVSRRARRRVEEIADKVTYLELIADNAFMNEYTSTLFLPHTDIEAFPSVKQMLETVSDNGMERIVTTRSTG